MSRTKARGNVLDAVTNPLGGLASSEIVDMDLTKIINLLDPENPQDTATKKYVDDQVIALILPIINALVPAGVIISWGGTSPPTDWAICNGQSFDSITDTSLGDLFIALDTTYGGTGANDFNVPDLRGRVPLGRLSGGSPPNRATSASAQTSGSISGSGTVFLDSSHLPIHNHTGTANPDGRHSHSGTTGQNSDGSHSHSIRSIFDKGDKGGSPHAKAYTLNSVEPQQTGAIQPQADHNHTINIVGEPNHSHPFVTETSGGTADHENTPPFSVVQYIIKLRG